MTEQRAVFAEQARNCAGRSALYAGLCERLADEPLVAGLAPEMRWDVPLRLLAAVHYLDLAGEAPDAFSDWTSFRSTLVEHAEFIRLFVEQQGVQTNEVGRAWVLLPAFLLLARETGAEQLDLLELGPSAGFNLLWDHYFYRYRAGTWGGDSALLELTGEERGEVPGSLLAVDVAVRHRVGVELNPIDVSTSEGARLVKCFIWADRRDRLAQADRAIAALRAQTVEITRGDYVELLPELLAARRAGALTVVFQTSSLGYLSRDERRKVYAAVDEAAALEPLGWISGASPLEEGLSAWGLDARLRPTRRRIVAHADFHGAWLDWFA